MNDFLSRYRHNQWFFTASHTAWIRNSRMRPGASLPTNGALCSSRQQSGRCLNLLFLSLCIPFFRSSTHLRPPSFLSVRTSTSRELFPTRGAPMSSVELPSFEQLRSSIPTLVDVYRILPLVNGCRKFHSLTPRGFSLVSTGLTLL